MGTRFLARPPRPTGVRRPNPPSPRDQYRSEEVREDRQSEGGRPDRQGGRLGGGWPRIADLGARSLTARSLTARSLTARSLRAGLLTAGLLTAGLLGSVLVAFPAAPAGTAVTDGLVLWHKLDQTSGTTVTDASGNGRDGTLNGRAGWSGADTASVTSGTATMTRNFTATVPALPTPAPKTGYLFSYFTGEGTPTGEQVYFALSKGNDPLNWRELNGGKPVLFSTLGEKGIRDPFITRSPDGDRYYLIATDLRIYNGKGWDAAQRTGSKSLAIWESTDLVHWSDERLVQVSPDTAGNTWAPEAFWDKSLDAYVVYWASKIYDAGDTTHRGSAHNTMMYATTRDFYTFSQPKVWKDPGYSVIDSTVTEYDGTFYRFTKDERNNTSSTPCSKYILQEKSTVLTSTNWDFVAECLGKPDLSAGEGPTIFKANDAQKWYLFIDEFGGRGYVPFSSTNLDSGTWTLEPAYSLPASETARETVPGLLMKLSAAAGRLACPGVVLGYTPAIHLQSPQKCVRIGSCTAFIDTFRMGS